jgi:type IX secretion system PorP/SprF family membrane protein
MKKALILLTLSGALVANAQDFHLSQYDAVPMLLNPAHTGMYENQMGDFKGYLDYRSQWRSLGGKPFSKAVLGYDMKLRKWEKNIGIGGVIINDRAGSGNFNTLTILVGGAYDIMNNAESKHYLTTGLQLGMFHKSFNPANYTFDVQYNSSQGGFDQTMSNQEVFANTAIFKFDANMGIYYKFLDAEKMVRPYGGFSIQHLNRANESFTGQKSKLPMRFNLNGGAEVELNDKVDLVPRFLFMHSARAQEINAGLLAWMLIKESGYKVMLGADYRHKDAVVAHIGVKHNQDIFRISYDVNTSYLNNFTGGRGAWEISLILTGEKGKPFFQSRF